MSTDRLLESFFKIIGNSEDYFISGSLSFLPLLNNYRKPGLDIDISIKKSIFYQRQEEILKEGSLKVLRLSEVAVAKTSNIVKWISPKTDFIHLETADGLLDFALYTEKENSIDFKLGFGIVMSIPKYVLDKINILEWNNISYRAAPPELMFLTKSVEFIQCSSKGDLSYKKSKHFEDIQRMAKIIDWDFLEKVRNEMKIMWFVFPGKLNRKLNPFPKIVQSIDIEHLKSEFL